MLYVLKKLKNLRMRHFCYILKNQTIYEYKPKSDNNPLFNYSPLKMKIYNGIPLVLGIVILPTKLFFLNPFFLLIFYWGKIFQKNYENRLFNTVLKINYNPENNIFKIFILEKNFEIKLEDFKIIDTMIVNESEVDLVFKFDDKHYFIILKSQETFLSDKKFFECLKNNDKESIIKYQLIK
jgi:hypothetical protein